MEDLTDLRKQINEVDEALVKLFFERMDIVHKVAEYKKESKMPVLDKKREEEVINRQLDKINDETKKEQLKELLEFIMHLSRKSQREFLEQYNLEASPHKKIGYSKVGFQGVAGSFSHEALMEYFGEEADTISYLSFNDVFEALKKDEIKYGIVPIENSYTGSIAEVYDLLGKYDFHIVGEKCIEIEHNLLGTKDSDISSIEEVYSHAQGFLQCSRLFSNYSNWKLIPYFNTAKSAQYVSNVNKKSKACVASKKAAKVYDLKILKENINDSENNYTRFIIISKELCLQEKCHKVSIVLTLKNEVGTLSNVLKHFAENGLNMLKIESRPLLHKSWQYIFYIDFNGNLLENSTKKALELIEKESLFFKILGNYESEAGFR